MNARVNSPTHRVLSALMGGVTTPLALHKATKTDGQSQNRWSIEVLTPLIERKLIRQSGHAITATKDGMELFYDFLKHPSRIGNKLVYRADAKDYE